MKALSSRLKSDVLMVVHKGLEESMGYWLKVYLLKHLDDPHNNHGWGHIYATIVDIYRKV